MINNDINKELVKLHIKAYCDALSLMDQVTAVVRKFDGKQINKRFDTALKEVDNRLSYRMEYNSFDISMRIEDRMVSESKGDYSLAHYLKDNSVIICGGCVEYGGNPKKSFIVEGKFNAAAALERLENQREYLTGYAAEAEQQLEQVTALQDEKTAIEKSVRDFNDKVNYMLAQYFELRLDLRH